MISKGHWVILIIIVIVMISFNTMADDIAVEITSTGQIIPDEDTPIYMKSQNITIYLNQDVHEITEYTLMNPTNSTVNITSLLPFSGNLNELGKVVDFPKPYNLILKVNKIEKNYDWTTFKWKDQVFNAIIFNISFDPFEMVDIVAEYDRSYKSKLDDWKFEYLTMTGTLWNHPIEYARFEFYISNDIKNYGIEGMNNYQVEKIENNTHIVKEFYNWTPTENIQIMLKNTHNSSYSFFFNAILLIGVGVLFTIILFIYIHKKRRK